MTIFSFMPRYTKGCLYFGTLVGIKFFNLPLDIISRSPVKMFVTKLTTSTRHSVWIFHKRFNI